MRTIRRIAGMFVLVAACSGRTPSAGTADAEAEAHVSPVDAVETTPAQEDADAAGGEEEVAPVVDAVADMAEAAAAVELPGPVEDIAALEGWNELERVRSTDLWARFVGPERVLVAWTTPLTTVLKEGGEELEKRLASGRIEARWLDGAAHPVEAVRTLVEREGLGVLWAGFAAEPDGGFAVSWSDVDWWHIRPDSRMTLTTMLQRFGPDLAPRGPRVQPDGEPSQNYDFGIRVLAGRGVAAAADGRTLVVWQRPLHDTDSQLAARAFDGAGAPLAAAETLTEPILAGGRGQRDRSCAVVQGPGGGFAGWIHIDIVYRNSSGKVLARAFDKDFVFRGDPIEIAAEGRELRMAAHADGSWVALWIVPAERGDRLFAEHLYARAFDASGQPRGEAVRLSGRPFREVLAPILPESVGVPLHFRQIGLAPTPDGGFVAAWTPRVLGKGPRRDRSVWYPGVFAQRFAEDGTPIGSPVVVDSSQRESTGHEGDLQTIWVAIGPDGRVLVVWADVEEEHGDTLRIRARMLPADFGASDSEVSLETEDLSAAGGLAAVSMEPARVVRLLDARDAGFVERVLPSDLAGDLLARTYSVSTESIPISETEEFVVVEMTNPDIDESEYVHVDLVLHRQQDQWSHVGTFDFMDSMTYDDCRVLRSPLSGECCRAFLLVSCYGYGVTYESWDDVLYRLGDGALEPVFCRQKKGLHHHNGLDTDVEIVYRESGITVRGVDFEEDHPQRRRTDVDDTYEWDGRAFVSQSGDPLRYCDDVRDVRAGTTEPEQP